MARRIPPLEACAGEFRACGRSDASAARVRFAAGHGVEPAAAALLQAYFDQPRGSILQTLGVETSPFPAFLDELRARDYDLRSFRFSVFLRGAATRTPRLSRIRLRPGVLQSRWARVEHDIPDLSSSWQRPCRRADSSLWMSLLSMPTLVRPADLGPDAPLPEFGEGLLDALKRLGFDEQTLRMEVRSALPLHPEDVRSKAAQASTL